MSSLWKRLFIALTSLLVVSLVLGGILWQRVGVLEGQLGEALQGWTEAQSRYDNGVWQGKWLSESYPGLRREIAERIGEGEDAVRFITPDDPAVVALVKEVTSLPTTAEERAQWIDTERIYTWVERNIEYTGDTYVPVLPDSPDSKLTWQGGFWRFPAETIRDKAGDCEDMTVLLVSMLLNHGERQHPVWGIGIESSQPPARHIAVAIPVVNDQIAILDPTAHYHTTFSTGWGMAAKETSVALGEWLARWKDKMSDARVYTVFSEGMYREFSSNQEFYDWVKSLGY